MRGVILWFRVSFTTLTIKILFHIRHAIQYPIFMLLSLKILTLHVINMCCNIKEIFQRNVKVILIFNIQLIPLSLSSIPSLLFQWNVTFINFHNSLSDYYNEWPFICFVGIIICLIYFYAFTKTCGKKKVFRMDEALETEFHLLYVYQLNNYNYLKSIKACCVYTNEP